MLSERFLTARWEHLLLLNYDCPVGLLEPLVPVGTELDPWRGTHMVSLVGFRFVDTRVMGVGVPGHRAFEEVNLRFYVRRSVDESGVRRGVVFVKELVPRWAVAAVARWGYGEPYQTVAMGHRIALTPERGGKVEYRWIHDGGRHRIAASVEGPAPELEPDSEAEFVTEHYWGYGRRRDGRTTEYRVDHPRWRVWEAAAGVYDRPTDATLYGAALDAVLASPPRSAFVALGSDVSVFRPKELG